MLSTEGAPLVDPAALDPISARRSTSQLPYHYPSAATAGPDRFRVPAEVVSDQSRKRSVGHQPHYQPGGGHYYIDYAPPPDRAAHTYYDISEGAADTARCNHPRGSSDVQHDDPYVPLQSQRYPQSSPRSSPAGSPRGMSSRISAWDEHPPDPRKAGASEDAARREISNSTYPLATSTAGRGDRYGEIWK
jgi:hypothetical protein